MTENVRVKIKDRVHTIEHPSQRPFALKVWIGNNALGLIGRTKGLVEIDISEAPDFAPTEDILPIKTSSSS